MVGVAVVVKVAVVVAHKPPEDGEEEEGEEEGVEEDGDGVAPGKIDERDVEVGQEATLVFRQARRVHSVVSVLRHDALSNTITRSVFFFFFFFCETGGEFLQVRISYREFTLIFPSIDI